MSDPLFVTNETVRETLLTAIRTGMSDEGACGLAGVHATAWSQWRRKGLDDPQAASAFGKFHLEVMKAKAEREQFLMRGIMTSGKATAYQWALEKLHSETYGNKQSIEITQGMSGIEAQKVFENLPLEYLERIASGELSYEQVRLELENSRTKTMDARRLTEGS